MSAELAEEVAGLARDNRERLRCISRKEELYFHLRGAEALQVAAQLLRVNTGRPLLVTFGGGAHGWSDGIASEGLALGETRYATNVLTLRARSALSLAILRMRADEIAGESTRLPPRAPPPSLEPSAQQIKTAAL